MERIFNSFSELGEFLSPRLKEEESKGKEWDFIIQEKDEISRIITKELKKYQKGLKVWKIRGNYYISTGLKNRRCIFFDGSVFTMLENSAANTIYLREKQGETGTLDRCIFQMFNRRETLERRSWNVFQEGLSIRRVR